MIDWTPPTAWLELPALFQVTMWVAGIGLLIHTLEILSDRASLSPKGLFAWRILRTDYGWMERGPVASFMNLLFEENVFTFLMVARVAAILAVFITNDPAVQAVAFTYIFVSIVLFHIRVSFGLDGSDQFYLIVIAALCVKSLFHGNTTIAHLSIWFLAMQSLLGYFTSGAAKLISPVWRNGSAVIFVMDTQTYGKRWVSGQCLDHTWIALLMGWIVIGFEVLFPLAFVVGPYAVVPFAVIALLFHITTAVVMGLNSFAFAYPAGLSALIYCSFQLHAYLTT